MVEDNLVTLIKDLDFEIASHTVIIQDLRRKVRGLKQELKNRDEARTFRTPKSYNSAMKSTLDGKVYEMQNPVRLGVIREKIKSDKPTIIEVKEFERKVYKETHLT